MLGFELDLWDYITFAALIVLGAAFVIALVFILGLPGRIAIARKHPDAEAVNIMGWAGFLVLVPWIQAFIWAFKPTNVVDIRRYPKAEDAAINEEIARLKDQAPSEKPAVEAQQLRARA
jgi:amino acid transporter